MSQCWYALSKQVQKCDISSLRMASGCEVAKGCHLGCRGCLCPTNKRLPPVREQKWDPSSPQRLHSSTAFLLLHAHHLVWLYGLRTTTWAKNCVEPCDICRDQPKVALVDLTRFDPHGTGLGHAFKENGLWWCNTY